MTDHLSSPSDVDGSRPSAEEASAQLARAASAQRAVAAESSAPAAAWLSGLGVASALYVASLGWIWPAAGEAGVVGISVIFALSLAALALTQLRGLRAKSTHFSRRFGGAMAAWAVLFAAALVIGLLFFEGAPAFFVAAAVLVAVPPFWASNVERNRDGRIR
ncbi:hypothetical protein WDJ51_12860 [Rathayibacter sp. YIM 133350]|uniref:hypothetical protein n=1 Tax=Rathayibacter sp. YIM 133350 TaxID=3131992 RepID=UPI00307E50C1